MLLSRSSPTHSRLRGFKDFAAFCRLFLLKEYGLEPIMEKQLRALVKTVRQHCKTTDGRMPPKGAQVCLVWFRPSPFPLP